MPEADARPPAGHIGEVRARIMPCAGSDRYCWVTDGSLGTGNGAKAGRESADGQERNRVPCERRGTRTPANAGEAVPENPNQI